MSDEKNIDRQARLLYEHVASFGVHGDDPRIWDERSEDHKELWRGAIRKIERLRSGVLEGWQSVIELAKQTVEANGDWMPDRSTWIFITADKPGPAFVTGAQLRKLAAALSTQ